jgi:HK97 family phage portal protein
MVVRTASRHGVALRVSPNEFGSTDPLLMRMLAGQGSPIPLYVSTERVFGIPTVVQCIRMAANQVAQIPVTVYDESAGKVNRVPATTSWQYGLFAHPQLESNRFNVFSDLSAGVDGFGNGFAQKIKTRKQVVELRPIDPNRVRIRKDPKTGDKLFDVIFSPTDRRMGLTIEDILHVRGFTLTGAYSGLSLVQQFRATLGNVLAIQEFTGRYWQNDAGAGGYISVPDADLDKNQLDEILETWEETHGGLENKGKPGILMGGAKYETLPISLEDAQFVTSQRFNVEELSRMMDMPVEALQPGASDTVKTEEFLLRLRALYINPRVARIAAAINEDRDLFQGTPYNLDFDVEALLAADTDSKSVHDLRMRQAGIMTANEIRATKGLPPHPDGDELLQIPVGAGAPPADKTKDGKAGGQA